MSVLQHFISLDFLVQITFHKTSWISDLGWLGRLVAAFFWGLFVAEAILIFLFADTLSAKSQIVLSSKAFVAYPKRARWRNEIHVA